VLPFTAQQNDHRLNDLLYGKSTDHKMTIINTVKAVRSTSQATRLVIDFDNGIPQVLFISEYPDYTNRSQVLDRSCAHNHHHGPSHGPKKTHQVLDHSGRPDERVKKSTRRVLVHIEFSFQVQNLQVLIASTKWRPGKFPPCSSDITPRLSGSAHTESCIHTKVCV
jgi:hypothetical protein